MTNALDEADRRRQQPPDDMEPAKVRLHSHGYQVLNAAGESLGTRYGMPTLCAAYRAAAAITARIT